MAEEPSQEVSMSKPVQITSDNSEDFTLKLSYLGTTPPALVSPAYGTHTRTIDTTKNSGSKVLEVKPRVKPASFKEMIMEMTVTLSIFLLITNTLSPDQKSSLVEKLVSLLKPASDETTLDETDDKKKTRPEHGLSFHEFASVESVDPKSEYKRELRYLITTSEDCYLHAMNAGMSQFRGDASGIEYKDGEVSLSENLKFENADLNIHFIDIFSKLRARTDICGNQGYVLFNLWNIGHSPTVYHFLPALHGHLSHSYSWLFFDLHRDSPNLYLLQSDKSLMKYRPRLHYLIRSAKLNLPAKKKVCSMFAMIPDDDKVDDTKVKDKIQEVKQDFESTAAKIGVSEIIDFDNVTPLQPDNSNRVLEQKLDAIIYQELKEKKTVPFSFIFLRSLYYKNDRIVYVKKKEIKKQARELGLDDKKFSEFCEFFTSCGSIIDVSLIDPKSKYIIMKPSKFLDTIHQLFDPNDHNPMLEIDGILTLSTAEKLFGKSHADAYTNILVSLSLAVELKENQIKMLRNTANNKVWYLPDIRRTSTCHDTTELRPNVLRLLRSCNASPGHLQTSFVKDFLKISEMSKVCIKGEIEPNVTKIEAFDENGLPVMFEVKYFGTTLEFYISVESKKIFSEIIDTCHKIMEHDKETKYNFAMLCSKDPSRTDPKYELTRDRHLLPFDFALCDECKKNKRNGDRILRMWNEVVTDNRVKEKRELNGDTISLVDATNIAANLEGLVDPITIKVLARKLEVNLDGNFSDWKLPMAMLMECEKKYTRPEALSKRHFARQLAEVANEITETNDQEILRRIVNLLDNEILKAPLPPESKEKNEDNADQDED